MVADAISASPAALPGPVSSHILNGRGHWLRSAARPDEVSESSRTGPCHPVLPVLLRTGRRPPTAQRWWPVRTRRSAEGAAAQHVGIGRAPWAEVGNVLVRHRVLLAMSAGPGTSILVGQRSPESATAVPDEHLNRVFRTVDAAG